MSKLRSLRTRKTQQLITGFYAVNDNDAKDEKSASDSDSASDNSSTVHPKKRTKLMNGELVIDHPPLSKYEMGMLQKKEERKRFMQTLGFEEVIEDLKKLAPVHKKLESKPNKKPPRVFDVPRREPSRRLAKKAVLNLNEDSLFENINKPEPEHVFTDNRTLVSLPMKVEEESLDVHSLLTSLKNDVKFDSNVLLSSCDIQKFVECTGCLELADDIPKVVRARVQSLCVHPSPAKKLVIAGSIAGSIGMWDMDMEHESGLLEFDPHQGPVNCVSVSKYDICKIYSTSHDGTLLCADIENSLFTNVYATDYDTRIKHLTWHDEIDAHTLFLAHGDGNVGVVDIRERSPSNCCWYACFDRSTRTVQQHPLVQHYFLVSSGTGGCAVFDMRKCSRDALAQRVCELPHGKGLTSAFFSDNGRRVLTTCNDDYIRLFDVSVSTSQPAVEKMKKVAHNNHTGRWLSVMKAKWYPHRDDVFVTGSLMTPRRIQLYGGDGRLLRELSDEVMTTISPVIAAHPTLPLIVGGNSSGRVHAFYAPT